MAGVLVAVIPAPHAPVELREIAEPELERDAALLDVELSEVCGTDVYLQQGRLAGVPYPLIPGHVTVGRLSKIHGRLQDVYGRPFAEGDRCTSTDCSLNNYQIVYQILYFSADNEPRRRHFDDFAGLHFPTLELFLVQFP